MFDGPWSIWDEVLGASDDSDTTASERHWLLAPVGCCLLLMAGSLAAVVRASRLITSEQAESIRWPLPNCRWLTARWAVRITAWGALVAGFVGLMYAARHFVMHAETEVPTGLFILTVLSYSLMLLALGLAVLGLRWREKEEIRRALRQATKSLFLAGLAAGLAAEVLCDARESHLPAEWKRSCSMLGASCGLLLLGLVSAQADGQVEREIADEQLLEREQRHRERERQKEEQLREDGLLDAELGPQGETIRHDSMASSWNFFSRQESWLRSSVGARSPPSQLKWNMAGFLDRECLDETLARESVREPLLGLGSPESGTPQRLDSREAESLSHSSEPCRLSLPGDPQEGRPASSSSRSPQPTVAGELCQARPGSGLGVQASISSNNGPTENGGQSAKMGAWGRPDWYRQPWAAGDSGLMPGTSMQPVLAI